MDAQFWIQYMSICIQSSRSHLILTFSRRHQNRKTDLSSCKQDAESARVTNSRLLLQVIICLPPGKLLKECSEQASLVPVTGVFSFLLHRPRPLLACLSAERPEFPLIDLGAPGPNGCSGLGVGGGEKLARRQRDRRDRCGDGFFRHGESLR